MRITTVAVRGLALGVAIVAANCHAANAVATASATVIAPVAIAKSADLSFGSFAPGAGGSVTVSTSGVRVADKAILSTANSSPTAARFAVSGDPAATFDISVVASTTLDDGAGHSMALVTCSDLTVREYHLGQCRNRHSVGRWHAVTVRRRHAEVAAAQVPGFYSGNIAVTVEYN